MASTSSLGQTTLNSRQACGFVKCQQIVLYAWFRQRVVVSSVQRFHLTANKSITLRCLRRTTSYPPCSAFPFWVVVPPKLPIVYPVRLAFQRMENNSHLYAGVLPIWS